MDSMAPRLARKTQRNEIVKVRREKLESIIRGELYGLLVCVSPMMIDEMTQRIIRRAKDEADAG